MPWGRRTCNKTREPCGSRVLDSGCVCAGSCPSWVHPPIRPSSALRPGTSEPPADGVDLARSPESGLEAIASRILAPRETWSHDEPASVFELFSRGSSGAFPDFSTVLQRAVMTSRRVSRGSTPWKPLSNLVLWYSRTPGPLLLFRTRVRASPSGLLAQMTTRSAELLVTLPSLLAASG